MLENLFSLVHVCYILVLFFVVCHGQGDHSCGNLNISCPFRLKGHPKSCGLPDFELSCENARTILYWNSGKYYVESISYDNFTMRIVDPGLQTNSCTPIPYYSLSNKNAVLIYDYQEDRFVDRFDGYGFSTINYGPAASLAFNYSPAVAFVNCLSRVDLPQYVNYTSCVNVINSSSKYSYAVPGDMQPSDLKDSCSIDSILLPDIISSHYSNQKSLWTNLSFNNLHQRLLKGIELNWYGVYCESCWENGSSCLVSQFNKIRCKEAIFVEPFKFTTFMTDLIYYTKMKIPMYIFGIRAACGAICMFVFLVYKFRRRHLSFDDGIEDFLEGHNSLGSIRYSYSDIKTITKGFKEKLGQGGFGSVFKGKLRSGRLVAVKMLGKTKSNGQDFMNEVATLGRIHHINVVQLSGFCAERTKRALIYDFMPNGSLEKYIFPQEESYIYLSWEKMYKIAVGVANGIEYLHRGCEIQILHFDIKPHNILLDENFNPRISDFGLAKLYQTDESILSLTAARGTIGYIAPELLYKNIGRVSYKADVFSFGMLLMEMAGRRKNVNVLAESLSQIYFPLWIYDQLNCGEEMQIGDATDEERRIAKKLAVIALWCIQLKPTDRPSMNKVVEMLESAVEQLEMPPKLSLVP